ncbi:MAG: CBS domain-containing protein [Anaerolineales bacterium]|nr:CBS domain-containing protein [Anaerolineales bacterium]
MLVGERMTVPVITIAPEVPIQDALQLMRKSKIRRLPVVDKNNALVGLVSEKDVLNASPSDATSLSVWELNYLLSKIETGDIMITDVIIVSPDTPIEEAARIMADNKIGSLPVIDGAEIVGIVTETDLFKTFLELLGARQSGVRLTALVPDVPGELAALTSALRDIGGNIVALGTFLGESEQTRTITIKVGGIDLPTLKSAVEPFVEKITDIRVVEAS